MYDPTIFCTAQGRRVGSGLTLAARLVLNYLRIGCNESERLKLQLDPFEINIFLGIKHYTIKK